MPDFFNFEDKNRDIPFYNYNPKITRGQWLLLVISVILSFLLSAIGDIFSVTLGGIIFVFGILIPLLYVLDWDVHALFQRPSEDDIILAVGLFIIYMIYSFGMGILLDGLHLAGSSDGGFGMAINMELLFSFIFSLMAEELLKFIPFVLLLTTFFKYTNNRKLSIIISVFLVLMMFGLLHYDGESITLISGLLIQGLGSTTEFYGYIKTKNLLVPYMAHLLTDVFIIGLMMLA